ncbi:MAG TPA: CDP-archaeol synthase [Steroidobacteraceae bacterium]|nr:CDP-archaeol synthase [Steroidobacteraceae bacterium]
MQAWLAGLTLLIAANSAPLAVGLVLGDRWAAPVDRGMVLPDGARLFGGHKTWRGLASGVIAGALVGAVLPVGSAYGALFGLLALTGDLAASCAKRRLRLRPGTDVPLLDQLPEALLPMLLLRDALGMGATAIAASAAAFTVLDMIGSRTVARIRARRSIRTSA